jgi:hypothetical protein
MLDTLLAAAALRGRTVMRIASVASCVSLVACSSTPIQPTEHTPPAVATRHWITARLPDSDGAGLAGIASSRDLAVLVGTIHAGDGLKAAVWSSHDGTQWARDADAPGFEGHAFLAAAFGRDRFVALGATCGSVECEGQAYWTSTNGASWSFAGDVGGVCCVMNAITAGGPGFVAVGADQSTGFPVTPADAAVSLSSNGKRWQVITGAPEFKALTFGSVVARGQGLLASGFGGKPGIWTSADGLSWIASSSDFGTGEIQAVTAGGPGFVAVGRDGQSTMSWTSNDGLSWTRDRSSPGPGAMHAVVDVGGTLVAAGSTPAGAAVWTSSDGMHWVEDATPAAAAADLIRLAVLDDSVIAIGTAAGGTPVVMVSR